MEQELQILKLKEVIELTKLSKSNIHRLIIAGEFPKPFKLGLRTSAWEKSKVLDWVRVRIELSKKAA